MEEKELKRKTAIKEKERANSETTENKQDPFSQAAYESTYKDEDSLLDIELPKSMVIDNMAMTIGGNSDGDPDMTSEQKSLINFYNTNQEGEQTEHQVPCEVKGSLEETPLVEEVCIGDEDDGDETYGVRQEEKGTSVDNTREK